MNQHQIPLSIWKKLSLPAQLANIGSEVFRALKWREKDNTSYATLANYRALELFDLTLSCPHSLPRLTEIARARELWLDFFIGNNQYQQTSSMWEKYFLSFTRLANNPLTTSDQ